MDFIQAERYLDGAARYGIKPGLERMRNLCNRMGNPQLAFPAIHITGTNGKTTTARAAASILEGKGKRTGRYISPHLQTVTERICVDGRPITDRDFASCMGELAPLVEETNAETGDPLSYFEISTALAFQHFAHRNVDVAVIEVGMGGIWDATNLVQTKVAVITNVGLDHATELGADKVSIAKEKVGIIKPDATVITAEMDPVILEMIRAKCETEHAELRVLGRDFKVLYNVSYGVGSGKIGQVFGMRGLLRQYEQLYLPLLGEFHINNAACAVAAVEAFMANRQNLSAEDVEQGLARVASPGRLEVVGFDPLLILDGAHNPDGASKLAAVLENDLDYEKLFLVVGILEDKEYEEMLDILVPMADTVIVTRSTNPRAAAAETLRRLVENKYKKKCELVGTIPEAIKRAKTLASVSDLICVTGSLYTVGEARDALGLRPA